MSLGEIPSGLIHSSDRSAPGFLWRNRLCLLLLHFAPSLGRVVIITSVNVLNLNILLGASEDVPHLGDLVFHQLFIEGVCDLQPTNERGHVVIAVIHQNHLALKITDIVFETLFKIHLECEEVVALLELL